MSDTLPRMTEAEYLAWEERQETPYEFDGHRPIGMVGAQIQHERIQRNIKFELTLRLRGTRCEPFGPTMRVPTANGRYRYPDAVVTCTQQAATTPDLADPVVVFEVISDSTETTDRRVKRAEYCGLASLSHYVMVEETVMAATVISRLDDHWRIALLRGGDTLSLPEIGVEIPLAEFYVGLDLPVEEG